MTRDTEDVVARLRLGTKVGDDGRGVTQHRSTVLEREAADLIQSLSDRIDVRDEREVAIRYMDVLARELARDGKMDECAVLHAASNLLETLGGRAALHQEATDFER